VNASELLENGLSEGDVEDLEAVSDKQVDLWLLGFLVVFSGAIVAFMVFRKPRKGQGVEEVKERVEKHLSREEKVLVGKIRAFGGRVAQRELRKHLDWSEAAVSMVLTKLEDKGVVRKIKKGRGNVLKLVEERNL
ncbi:MAG: helix-turn-helix transcriptional regulator, partial [Candidatus Micrarchaeia archaeon]